MKRWLVFGVVLAALAGWAWYGPAVTDVRGASAKGHADRRADRLLGDLARQDPGAAERLRQMQADRDRRAVAASLLYEHHRADLAGLKSLADRADQPGGTALVDLLALALDPALVPDPAERDAFLTAHASVLTLLRHSGLPATADPGPFVAAYVAQLKEASKDPDAWRAVRDDPVALLVWREVSDPRLRQFYLEQRDWLAEVLVQLQVLGPSGKAADRPAAPLGWDTLLETAARYHPLPRQAAVDLELGATGFQIFLEHGELIQQARRYEIPLGEVLEVIFANRDHFAANRTVVDAASEARRLADLRAGRPSIWQAARSHTLALRLNSDVPDHADSVLRRFAADDVAAMLYASYEREIRPATVAVDRYGDLAIYILNKHADDPRFKKLLKDPVVSERLVPYTVRFGDEGLTKLEGDRRWLERYFDAEGKPRDAESWSAIPIAGAPTLVVRNWVKGYPNEWSDLGWAALDVADGALLVASLGTSAVVTEGGKEVVEQAGKATARSAARAAGRESATLAARGARQAASAAAHQGSLLRRVVLTGSRGLALGGAAAAWGGRVLSAPARWVCSLARQVVATWSRAPALVKRWVYRSLLVVGLYFTLTERTWPVLSDKLAELPLRLAETIQDTTEKMRDNLHQALTDVLGAGVSPAVSRWAMYLGPLAVLGGLAWLVRPRARKVSYA